MDLVVSKYCTYTYRRVYTNQMYNPFHSIAVEDDVTDYKVIDGCLYYIPNKTLVIAPYAATSITVPSGYNIEKNSCFACYSLTSVTVPSNATTIGEYAFYNCTALESVTGTSSLTTIGPYAFQYCAALTSFTFPNTLTSIGQYAFANTGLTSLSVSNTNLVIGNYAFSACNSLVTATLGVKSVGALCFQNCTALTSLNFTALAINGLGNQMANGCTSLTYVHVPATWTHNGSGWATGMSAIKTVGPSGGGYNFEYEWTTAISSNTSQGQYTLAIPSATELTFPSTATVLSDFLTHTGCANVTKIYCYAVTAPTAYGYTFSGVGNNTKDSGTNELHVPVGATGYDAGQWANLVNNKGFTLIYDL